MKNRIRELRKTKQLTQKALAAKLGISTSTVGMYEQGRREPDTKMLLLLAQEFNVTIDYLICANNNIGSFDINAVARGIAENLINNPTLLFSTERYTKQELSDLCSIIEDSVKITLADSLGKD